MTISSLYKASFSIFFQIPTTSEKLESCLQTTGILWECCDRLPSLPKNNAEAVIRVLGAAENLITDAIEELDEVSNSLLQ